MKTRKAQLKPDYAKWKRKRLWTIWQAACLAAGTEPTYGENIEDAQRKISDSNTRQVAGEIYGHTKDALDLRELKQAARSRTLLIMDKLVTPVGFATWLAGRGDLTIPEELRDLTKVKTSPDEKPLMTKERTTYNHIIGALLEIIDGKTTANRHPDFKSEADLISKIEKKYDGISGLSRRTLEAKFPIARKSL